MAMEQATQEDKRVHLHALQGCPRKTLYATGLRLERKLQCSRYAENMMQVSPRFPAVTAGAWAMAGYPSICPDALSIRSRLESLPLVARTNREFPPDHALRL
jgi:hypothetical protein